MNDSLKIDGYARPVFEVMCTSAQSGSGSSGSAQATKVIKPINMSGRNSIHIFTSKKLDIPARLVCVALKKGVADGTQQGHRSKVEMLPK